MNNIVIERKNVSFAYVTVNCNSLHDVWLLNQESSPVDWVLYRYYQQDVGPTLNTLKYTLTKTQLKAFVNVFYGKMKNHSTCLVVL